jgi:hypothetical protein
MFMKPIDDYYMGKLVQSQQGLCIFSMHEDGDRATLFLYNPNGI